jgi:3'-5' exoribonuclease
MEQKFTSSPAYPHPNARPYLAELKGIPTHSIFLTYVLLLRSEVRKDKNGGDYLSLELGDKSQAFSCTVFTDNPIYKKIKAMESGTILKVEGIVDYYMEKLSPKLLKVAALPNKDWTEAILSRLVRASTNDVEAMFADILGAVEQISLLPLRQTVEAILTKAQSDFCFKPAAKSIHHAYRSGLLEHTWSMLQVTQNLLPHYSQLNKDIVVSSILLHDFGKIREYCGDLNTDISVEGRLLGHIFMGAHTFLAAAERNNIPNDYALHVTHCILSHHRMPEWGAAMRPATPEATFVCMVDGMDSLMGIVDNARFNNSDVPVTPYVPAIEAALVWPPTNPAVSKVNPESLPPAMDTQAEVPVTPVAEVAPVASEPPAAVPPVCKEAPIPPVAKAAPNVASNPPVAAQPAAAPPVAKEAPIPPVAEAAAPPVAAQPAAVPPVAKVAQPAPVSTESLNAVDTSLDEDVPY